MTVLSYSDVQSVAPAVEPVTVAEAKRNSDVDDSYRDVDFSRWITEARKQVEHDARIALVNQTRIRKIDEFPSERFIILNKPLVSVTSVQYVDMGGSTQTFSSASYEVDTARHAVFLANSVSWPPVQWIQNAGIITYIAGHGSTAATVPEAAKAAILLLVKHRYENPEMVLTGTISKEIEYGYRAVIDQLRGGNYP